MLNVVKFHGPQLAQKRPSEHLNNAVNALLRKAKGIGMKYLTSEQCFALATGEKDAATIALESSKNDDPQFAKSGEPKWHKGKGKSKGTGKGKGKSKGESKGKGKASKGNE